MANNYLLIDFENVQPESIALLDGLEFTILLFVGAHQSKIPLALATQLQRLGERARYIRIEGNGPNALDFHIAFTIGELARADPRAASTSSPRTRDSIRSSATPEGGASRCSAASRLPRFPC